MWKHVFSVLLLTLICSSLRFDTMTTHRLEQIRLNLDYAHHVIFFHEPTRTSLESQLEHWSSHTDVFFYINDCQSNKLPECNDPVSTPLILLYNRVLIRFNGDPEKTDEIVDWLENRIVESPKLIHSMAELENMLNKTPNVYCYCPDLKKYDEQSQFFALAKSLPFLNYCLINNQILVQELGLKDGNITYFLNSSINRREFEHPNRYQAWEWFIKSNFIPSIQRAQGLAGERFTQVEKKIKTYAIACDLSFQCEKIWEQIKTLQTELSQEALGYNFRLAIQDQKESFTFNLYYHLTFNMRKLPALIHIDLQGAGEQAGALLRHIEYLQTDFTIKALKSFIDRTQKGELEPFYFSAKAPKLNGFYGKGGEKFIQKVVASNVEQIIAASPNHYVILITALNIGCTECESFYKQYKQIAALLDGKDVTFGVLNANQNEVPLQAVTQLPDLLLYRKDDKAHPVRMNVVHSFDHLMLFFKNNLGDAYSDPNEL